jgi:hypothetical protein
MDKQHKVKYKLQASTGGETLIQRSRQTNMRRGNKNYITQNIFEKL